MKGKVRCERGSARNEAISIVILNKRKYARVKTSEWTEEKKRREDEEHACRTYSRSQRVVRGLYYNPHSVWEAEAENVRNDNGVDRGVCRDKKNKMAQCQCTCVQAEAVFSGTSESTVDSALRDQDLLSTVLLVSIHFSLSFCPLFICFLAILLSLFQCEVFPSAFTIFKFLVHFCQSRMRATRRGYIRY